METADCNQYVNVELILINNISALRIFYYLLSSQLLLI